MAVPAHDQRDFEFAQQYGLPIRIVIAPASGETSTPSADRGVHGQGRERRRGQLGADRRAAGRRRRSRRIIDEIERRGIGKGMVRYRLRDWLISRQRYWGTPIPMIYCDACGIVPVPEEQLPVELPLDVPFTGREGNPLAKHEAFVNATCPQCGGAARRETDTMDTFVDSSWYYLRFISRARRRRRSSTPTLVNRWLPVDQYIGGIEHAILHLLYARFICRMLHDMGLVGLRGAVHAPVQPGHDHEGRLPDRGRQLGGARRGRVARRHAVPTAATPLIAEVGEDVEVALQRRAAGRADRRATAPTRSASTRSSSRRRRRKRRGRTRASSARTASWGGSGTWGSRCSRRRGRRRTADAALDAQDAPDHRRGDAALRALRVQHRDLALMELSNAHRRRAGRRRRASCASPTRRCSSSCIRSRRTSPRSCGRCSATRVHPDVEAGRWPIRR